MKKGLMLNFIALLAGALLPFAFAPVGIYILAVISPAILLYCWHKTTPKTAFFRGWLFGLGLFGVGVSWVFISIHDYGNTIAPVAFLITVFFTAGLALFPAIQGAFLSRFFPEDNFIKMSIVFPVTWVLLEWVRSWLLTGFPWLLLCYSQVDSPLRGFIPIVGGYGVSFLLVLSSGFLVYVFSDKRFCNWFKLLLPLSLLSVIWIGGYLLNDLQWTKPYGKKLNVSLVQGNISQDMKWVPSHVQPTLQRYYDLTNKHWDSDIIVWPEAAIPLPLHFAKDFVGDLDDEGKANKTSLLIGIPVGVENSFSFYNAMISIGKGSGHYYKKHLVPFGEYVPLSRLLRGVIGLLNIPMSDMTNGADKQGELLAGGINIAPFICYEIAYPSDLRDALPLSKLLVTISDDAWFGNSFAPFQHLEIGQFRAIQGGRELLFTSNNGITAIVNSKGDIVARIPQFKQGVLTGEVQPMTGATPWVKIGNTPIITLFWLLLFLVFVIS